MQSPTWIRLLRLMPPEHQDKLMLATSNGTEINVQGILKLDKRYMLLRGRLAASNDAGRVFFIPYDQIDYLGYREAMNEAEVLALFGGGKRRPGAAEGSAEIPALAPVNGVAEKETKVETAAPPVEPAPVADSGPIMPAKAALLERLRRSRTGTGDTPKSDK